MATLNSSHHQDGGVLLYSGEIVLLYCDKVTCEIDNVGTSNGRMFLTTHRIVFTSQPINQNRNLLSLAAPFYAMFDLGLDQPVFGANKIKGKVRTNSSQNTSPLTQNQYSFRLSFKKGGAIEFGRALTIAAKQASQAAAQSGFSNNYNFAVAAGQYYAAPSTIYQPNYPVGFVLPNEVFTDVPQNGTIYYQNAPPPYPGITPAHQQQPPQSFAPTSQVYAQVYPTSVNTVYEQGPQQVYPPHNANVPTVHYPHSSNVPTAPYSSMPGQPAGYMPNQPPSYQGTYPSSYNQAYPTQPQSGYQQPGFQQPPYQQQGYQPQSTASNMYPQPPQSQAGYQPQSNSTYPNIPSYDDAVKKGR